MEKQVSNQVKHANSIAITNSASVSIAKIKRIFSDAINELPEFKKKVPVTVTKGDNWICIASVIGNECITISLTELK